jgi:acetylornithine deacetylase/succinyl-diaminopimelate desuccinylase-like protein|tara:strand:- start:109 stop:1218 length:1110 start_codon:yes stop_codon:yes gene_type:complete
MDNIKEYIEKFYNQFMEDMKKLALVPSPPFKEEKRVLYFKKLVEDIGYQNIHIDKEGNLVITLKGSSDNLIIFSAHADTVFPEGTPLEIKEEKGIIYCPGICDNATGDTAMLYLMKYIKENNITPKHTMVFLYNVGEEGLGNLRGMKYYFDNVDKTKVKAHIVIEGHKLGRLTTTVVGSHRCNITIIGEGGHSWREFGKPNAIIEATKIIKKISNINYPSDPKTSFNIGTIQGGTSVNAIPQKAEFSVEVRSIDGQILKQKIKEIEEIISQVTSVKVESKILGDRPGGNMENEQLKTIITSVHKELDIPTIDDVGSTDSNYPISLGLPSLTIAIADGKKTHSTDEYLLTEKIRLGLHQLFRIFEEVDKI